MKIIKEIFKDKFLVEKIKRKLPELFEIAENESKRGGKIGMEVGSTREKIIIALLIYKFGIENVEINIPITEPETDIIVFSKKYSIKTITKKKLGESIKLIWTVDADKALEFIENFLPSYGIILVHINWNDIGGIYYFSVEVIKKILDTLGKERFFKMPKRGTNPRGVEISTEALLMMVNHKNTLYLPITWSKQNAEFDPYKRWLEYWNEV